MIVCENESRSDPRDGIAADDSPSSLHFCRSEWREKRREAENMVFAFRLAAKIAALHLWLFFCLPRQFVFN